MSSQSSSYIFTPETFDLPYISIPDRLKELAKEHPDREAIICWSMDGHRRLITYSELYTRSELFAKGLATFRFKRNSVIAVTNTNCTEWLICTFGSQMAGVIPLHFSLANFSTRDIVSLLNGIGRCTAIVMEPSNIEVCNAFIETLNKRTESLISTQIPTLRHIFFMNSTDEKFMTVRDICNIGSTSVSTLPQISPDDICGIFLTSGSTGMAKAVPHTHLKMIHAGYGWGKNLEIQAGEKFYNNMPFSWQGSYPSVFLAMKATRVTVTDIMAIQSLTAITDFTVRVLKEEYCTSAFFISPVISELIKRETQNLDIFPLRVISTAGLPVDAQCANVMGKVANKFGVVYGCTEIGMISELLVDKTEDYDNYSCGYPVSGTEIKVVNDNGSIVPLGIVGEIYIRQRDRFLGFRNAREKNDLCCGQTGWYKSDDVGFIRQDGSLVVAGRKSDVMILGGELVSPSYLEGLLKKHLCVANAYIYPMRDAQMFQQACAAILVRQDKSVTEDELKNFLIKQKGTNGDSFLANRFIPEVFMFFESFPSTHSGKLDRKRLGEEIKRRMSTL